MTVVYQPIDDRIGHLFIIEDTIPFTEFQVRSYDNACLLYTSRRIGFDLKLALVMITFGIIRNALLSKFSQTLYVKNIGVQKNKKGDLEMEKNLEAYKNRLLNEGKSKNTIR